MSARRTAPTACRTSGSNTASAWRGRLPSVDGIDARGPGGLVLRARLSIASNPVRHAGLWAHPEPRDDRLARARPAVGEVSGRADVGDEPRPEAGDALAARMADAAIEHAVRSAGAQRRRKGLRGVVA